MEKLKTRWGIESNWQIAIIFVVFGLTGTTATKFAAPVTELLGINPATSPWYSYWPLRILLIFPIYQILLVAYGWLFGQFQFFWNFEKKMLRRMGFAKLLKE